MGQCVDKHIVIEENAKITSTYFELS